jgi:hypothetical protein
MVVITACVALVLLGVVMVIRWGGEAAAPDGAAHRDREGWLEYFLFALAAGVVAGVVAVREAVSSCACWPPPRRRRRAASPRPTRSSAR